ncbi:MAG: ELWxxDGT repeat protein [Acidobacteriota bacterium]
MSYRAARLSIRSLHRRFPWGQGALSRGAWLCAWLGAALLVGLAGVSLSLTDAALAQTPELVLDLHPAAQERGSEPSDFVTVEDGQGGLQAFFLTREQEVRGAESVGRTGGSDDLWVTDGTAEGTRLVFESLSETLSVGPQNLFAGPSDWVFFSAPSPGFGLEPWVSDGTAQGTRRLGDLCPGSCSSSPRGVAILGDEVLFSADAPDGRLALWLTDGTAGGLRPLELGPIRSFALEDAVVVLDRVFLITRSPSNVATQGWLHQLWVTDGTAAGTFALGGALPTVQAGGRLLGLEGLRDHVLFLTVTGGRTRQLWTSDGTVAGTEAVPAELSVGPAGDPLDPIVTANLGPWIVFMLPATNPEGQSDCEVWFSDGTAAGTLRQARLRGADGEPPPDGEFVRCPSRLARADIVLANFPTGFAIPPSQIQAFFVFGSASTSWSLWTTDSSDGVVKVKELGTAATGASLATSITSWRGRMYFYSHRSVTGGVADTPGLWITNGTPEGTSEIQPFASTGSERYLPEQGIGDFGNRLLLQGWDEASGRELWISDGSPEGTEPLANLVGRESVSSFPAGLARLGSAASSGDAVVFVATHPADGAEEESRRSLWASDGTTAGTRVQLLGPQQSTPASLGDPVLTSAGLFLRRADSTADDSLLFSSDLETFITVAEFPIIEDPVAFGDLACFAAHDPALGVEPWCSDGSLDGTVSLGDLAPGLASPPFGGSDSAVPLSSRPDAFVVAGDHLYFRTAPYLEDGDQLVPSALWRSDGTAAGTQRVWSSAGVGQQGPILPIRDGLGRELLMTLGEDVYFLAEDLQPALWRLRGGVTPELVAPLGAPGAQIQTVASAEFRGRLVFFLEEDFGASLWSVDDGPAAAGEGARLLSTFERINSPRDGLDPQLVAVGNDLYFSADEGDGAGLELWRTDGTVFGTRRVTDLAPGVSDAYPQRFAAIGSRLFFSATDGVHGVEPWVTDGTVEGTRLLADLEPGPAGSFPAEPTRLGDDLLFSAWTSTTGRELHRLDASDLISRTCTPGDQRFCLRDGRFEVLVDWVDPRTLETGRGTGTPYLGVGADGGTSDDTALVWFFRDDNRELAVKILDGRSINGHHWLFYGALSDVAYWLSAVDLETGIARTWINPAREICGDGDNVAFPQAADGLADLSLVGRIPAEKGRGVDAEASLVALQEPSISEGTSVGAPCDDPEELCLQDGRFRLRVDWRDQRRPGREGQGTAIPDPNPDNQRSGAFWFFREGNLELLVKVLDARTIDGHFWVFYGNLTDVEFDLHVTDIVSGLSKTYTNPGGNLCGAADTAFF